MNTITIAEGNFNALDLDEDSRIMFEDAFQAITKANQWAYLRRPDVPEKRECIHCLGKNCTGRVVNSQGDTCWCRDKCRICDGKGIQDLGFSGTNSSELDEINSHMRLYESHSGGSYGCMMRSMERIAKKGWPAFVKEVGVRPAAIQASAVANLLATASVMDSAMTEAIEKKALDPLAFAKTLQSNPEVRKKIPDIDAQVSAIQQFSERKMTYAEMRSICG